MTPSELKFALKVEALLNTVDDPEYRQLIVEVLMILSLVVNEDPAQPLGHTIVVDHILKDANNLFVENQVSHYLIESHWNYYYTVSKKALFRPMLCVLIRTPFYCITKFNDCSLHVFV